MPANNKVSQIFRKETLVVCALYLLFFVWWYVTAYGFGTNPAEYDYILGFPEWFFYSCIVGYVGISIILWAAVRFLFTEIPFDEDIKDKEEKKNA